MMTKGTAAGVGIPRQMKPGSRQTHTKNHAMNADKGTQNLPNGKTAAKAAKAAKAATAAKEAMAAKAAEAAAAKTGAKSKAAQRPPHPTRTFAPRAG